LSRFEDACCRWEAAGGEIARNARLELEEKTGKQVVSPLNAKDGIMLKGHEDK